MIDEFPESDIFVILVRIDDCKPINEKLQYLHWVDIFPSYEDGVQKILRVVKPEKSFKTKINWQRK